MAGNPCNNIISISVPHDSFIASVYSFISSCSAFLLCFPSQDSLVCILCPTMCLWGCVALICACVVGGSAMAPETKSKVRPKKKFALPDRVGLSCCSPIASASAVAPWSFRQIASTSPGLCPLAISVILECPSLGPCNCPWFSRNLRRVRSRFGGSSKVQRSCVAVVSPAPTRACFIFFYM